MATTTMHTQETNPWEQQAARFNIAAHKLNLEEGLWRVLQQPNREIIVHIPVMMDNGTARSLHRLSRAALHRARPGQGRRALLARRHARRSPRPRQLDDLEVRRGEHSLRRSQGRNHLRPQEHVARRTGAHDPPLHLRTDRVHRPRERRSRARRQHQRTDHGVDDGHLLHAHAADRHRCCHRQAAEHGRIARTPRSHRPRRDDHRRRIHQAPQDEQGKHSRHHSGLRQRRIERGATHVSGRL